MWWKYKSDSITIRYSNSDYGWDVDVKIQIKENVSIFREYKGGKCTLMWIYSILWTIYKSIKLEKLIYLIAFIKI